MVTPPACGSDIHQPLPCTFGSWAQFARSPWHSLGVCGGDSVTSVCSETWPWPTPVQVGLLSFPFHLPTPPAAPPWGDFPALASKQPHKIYLSILQKMESALQLFQGSPDNPVRFNCAIIKSPPTLAQGGMDQLRANTTDRPPNRKGMSSQIIH